jgi:N-acetylneuraminic acid mutarotase
VRPTAKRRRSVGIAAGVALAVMLTGSGAMAQGAARTDGTWTALAPVDSVGQGVEGMAVGVLNDKIVAAFGFDPGTKLGDTKTTRIYDPATDTWKKLNLAVPGGERSESGSAVVGDKLYVVGGGTRSGVMDDFVVLDLSDKTWTRLESLPPIENSHGKLKPDNKAGVASAALDGAVYAIGGRNVPDGPCSPKSPGGILASVEKYDIASGHWSEVAPLPEGLSDAAAVTVGSKVWVFGGCTVTKNGAIRLTKDVYSYDPVANAWTKESNLPFDRCAFSQVAAIGTDVYVIGGFVGSNAPPSGETWVYDTTTGDAIQLEDMITPRAEMGVVAYNGSIYTVGGSVPAYGNSSNANERFTP